MELIVLTPIHISSDKELTTMEFLIEHGKIKVYFFEKLLEKIALISNIELREYLLTQLKKRLREVKGGIFSLRELFTILHDKEKEYLQPDYTLHLEAKEHPSIIKCFISSLKGPYIPGSEIKGALRYLFLWGVVYGEDKLRKELLSDLKRFYGQFRGRVSIKRSELLGKLDNFWRGYENKIFLGQSNDPLLSPSYRDLFRFLNVSDTLPISYDNMYVEKVITLNTQRSHENFCEMISPLTRIPIEVEIEFMTFTTKRDILKNFISWNWEKNFNWKYFKEVGFKFFNDWYQQEMAYLERVSNINLDIKTKYMQKLQKLKNNIERFYPLKEIIFPLRLGRYQGFNNITIGNLIRQEDEELYREHFRAVVPQARQEVNKTRVITDLSCSPLGWCLFRVGSG